MQHSYSTDETLTGGTWIDGKPIYRKVINLTNYMSSMSDEINLIPILQTGDLSNIDTLIDLTTLHGYRDELKMVGKSGEINGSNNTPFSFLDSTLNQLRVKASEAFEGGYLYVILEYTKTTDSNNLKKI